MKVSIITLHRIYNYGSALQAYATQTVFERLGYEAEIIDYIPPGRTLHEVFLKPGASGKLPFLKNIVYKIGKMASLILKEATFGTFVNKNLNRTKRYVAPEALLRDPPLADVYVSGSDQLWNSDYNGVDRGFYLDFLPEDAKRIAFVSSFGKEALGEAEEAVVKKYLSRYQAISVREDSAVKIIDQMGINNAVQLIDPTLQISRDDWIKIASKRLVKDRYLVLMLLYNEDNHATEYARKIADEKGLQLVKISWEAKKPPMVDRLFSHRSPADFISLFHHADFVVTNSFHGLAFCINLEKQFIVVPRNAYNSRIESLLKLTGLENRMVSNETGLHVSDEQIDYEPVRECLQAERKRAEDFIKNALPLQG